MKRVISLILALSLLCGQLPLSRAAQTYWSISYDPASFPDGLTAALYRADTDSPAEIDWQASAGSLSSGMTPQALFAQGDWYAVVQYAPAGAGDIPHLTDAEIEAEFDLWYRAAYGSVPAGQAPEGFPDESRADAEGHAHLLRHNDPPRPRSRSGAELIEKTRARAPFRWEEGPCACRLMRHASEEDRFAGSSSEIPRADRLRLRLSWSARALALLAVKVFFGGTCPQKTIQYRSSLH